MSDRIKWGEKYESVAQNIKPYLQGSSVENTYQVSEYPIWWNSTITIYNRYEHPQTQLVTWYKHTLSNCFIQSAKSMIVNGQTTYNTDAIIVRIPQKTIFKDYGDWINIPNVDMSNYFTLHQGDIIIKGDIEDKIDEYTTGMRSTDIVEKYKNIGVCFTIDRWQDNTGIGRCCPHYFVSGE